jgi:hypothetical protein
MRILLTVAVFAFGFVFGIPMGYVINEFGLFAPKPVQASVSTVIKEMLPIGEWACLAYYYTNVVSDIDQHEILSIPVPGTTKKIIFSYDGVIKLGVDTDGITVEEDAADPVTGEQKLRLIFPPIRALSHEIIDGTFKVYEQSSGIFNPIIIEDSWKKLPRHKREMAQKALTNATKQARISMENQLKGFLERLPAVKEKNYTFEFVWNKIASTTTAPPR